MASSPNSENGSQEGICVELSELIRLGPKTRGISFRARQPAHSILRGRSASRLRGPGLDFEELRAYQAGDDIRTMDWRVTARARSPFVRIYREEKERPVLVVVDQRQSMFFGSVKDMKSVTAASAAAIVAHRVVDSGDRIGAVIFDDTECTIFTPQRSKQQVMRILGQLRDKNLALTQPPSTAPRAEALDEALQRVLRLSPHDHLIVLISDITGASDKTQKLATEIRRRNDLLILWINDPLEASLPDVGTAVLGDGNLQVQVDTSNAKVRTVFEEDTSERRKRASSFALQFDVPFLSLSTAEDVSLQLRRLLSQNAPARRA